MAKPKVMFNESEKHLITALYEMGKTDEEIARVLGIPRKTFTDRIKYNGLTAVIKECKDSADTKVEASLYREALKGNIAAIMIWLGNRQAGSWKSVNKVEHTGYINLVNEFDRLEKNTDERKKANGKVK